MISRGHVDAGQCDPAHWYKCRSAKAGAISIGQISTFSRGWGWYDIWCCDYRAMIQCLVAVCCSVAQVVISNPLFTLLISSNYATPYTAISTGGWDEPLIFSNRNRRSPWNLRGLALRCPAAFDIFDWSFCTISCWIVHFVKGKLQKLLTQQQN